MIRLIPGGKFDNYETLQSFVYGVNSYGTIEVTEPGDYLFSNSMDFHDRSIEIIGRKGVRFLVPQGLTAMKVTRETATREVVVKDIVIEGKGNRLLSDRKTVAHPNVHGVIVGSHLEMENVTISNFGGNGLDMYGSEKTNNSNLNHSYFSRVKINKCRNGAFIQGPDSNTIGFYHCDIRANDEHGIWDSSFIGGKYINCMFHANKKGHLFVDNDSASAFIMGCYQEQGVPPSVIRGFSLVIGGNNGSGYEMLDNSLRISDSKAFLKMISSFMKRELDNRDKAILKKMDEKLKTLNK